MDLFVPAMALAYVLLQVAALFWSSPTWRRLGRVPLWTFGVATVALLVGNAIGAPLAALLMFVSLPIMTAYLAALWIVYLFIGPRGMSLPV